MMLNSNTHEDLVASIKKDFHLSNSNTHVIIKNMLTYMFKTPTESLKPMDLVSAGVVGQGSVGYLLKSLVNRGYVSRHGFDSSKTLNVGVMYSLTDKSIALLSLTHTPEVETETESVVIDEPQDMDAVLWKRLENAFPSCKHSVLRRYKIIALSLFKAWPKALLEEEIADPKLIGVANLTHCLLALINDGYVKRIVHRTSSSTVDDYRNQYVGTEKLMTLCEWFRNPRVY